MQNIDKNILNHKSCEISTKMTPETFIWHIFCQFFKVYYDLKLIIPDLIQKHRYNVEFGRYNVQNFLTRNDGIFGFWQYTIGSMFGALLIIVLVCHFMKQK